MPPSFAASLPIRAVHVRVIEYVFAVHLRVFAVRGAQEDVFALALGVDRISLLILGVDERVVVERAAPRLFAPFELDIRAVVIGVEAAVHGIGVTDVSVVCGRIGGCGVVAVRIFEVEFRTPMSGIVRVIEDITAEGDVRAVDRAFVVDIQPAVGSPRSDSVDIRRMVAVRGFDAGVGGFKRGESLILRVGGHALRDIIGEERRIQLIAAVPVGEVDVAAAVTNEVGDGRVAGVRRIGEGDGGITFVLEQCFLFVGGGEIGNVGHIVLAAAVIDEGVVRRFIARSLGVGGVRLE